MFTGFVGAGFVSYLILAVSAVVVSGAVVDASFDVTVLDEKFTIFKFLLNHDITIVAVVIVAVVGLELGHGIAFVTTDAFVVS